MDTTHWTWFDRVSHFVIPSALLVGALVFVVIFIHSHWQVAEAKIDLQNEIENFVHESVNHTLQLALDHEKVRAYVTPEDWGRFDQYLTLIKENRVRIGSPYSHQDVLSDIDSAFQRWACGYGGRAGEGECEHFLEQITFPPLSPIDKLIQKLPGQWNLKYTYSLEEVEKYRHAFEELKPKIKKAIMAFEAYEPSDPPEGY